MLHFPAYTNKFRNRADSLIAARHPVLDGDRLPVSHIENVLFRVLIQNYADKPAEIVYMEKLQVHTAFFRKVKSPVLQSTVKDERFPVNIVSLAIEVGWAKDICVGDTLQKRLLSGYLVCAVFSPDFIWADGCTFRKRLRLRFRVNCTGTDKNVIIKGVQRIQQITNILSIIGCDVQYGIKMLAFEFSPQPMSIPFDEVYTTALRTGVAVEDMNLKFIREILGCVLADEYRSAGNQHLFHMTPRKFLECLYYIAEICKKQHRVFVQTKDHSQAGCGPFL